jgi:UDP-N-acetylglucosamine 2-epimerase (non-hydrolysing)
MTSSMIPAAPAHATADRPARTTLLVAGGPSSFVRIAAVGAALRADGHRTLLVHCGRPGDGPALEDALAAAGAAGPDIHLNMDAPTPGVRTGTVLVGMERLLAESEPALVVVAGGLDATLGCALAAAKRGIPVAHLEAGLRSFDWSTADEINRTLIDRLAQTLLTSSTEARENLMVEGVPANAIHNVGNTLVDVVLACEPRARALRAWEPLLGADAEGRYVLASLHRPENVGSPSRLTAIAEALVALAERHPVLLSLDAATRERLAVSGGLARLHEHGVHLTDRLPYLEFLSLMAGAGAVLTDGGAIQDETSALGVACFTLRDATDRPVTLSYGTNTLVGATEPLDLSAVEVGASARCVAPLWDGAASARVAPLLAAIVATAPDSAHA